MLGMFGFMLFWQILMTRRVQAQLSNNGPGLSVPALSSFFAYMSLVRGTDSGNPNPKPKYRGTDRY